MTKLVSEKDINLTIPTGNSGSIFCGDPQTSETQSQNSFEDISI